MEDGDRTYESADNTGCYLHLHSLFIRVVSTFWQRMSPFLQDLGLKAPIPNTKDARFTFLTRRAVQLAIADLLVSSSNKTTTKCLALVSSEGIAS